MNWTKYLWDYSLMEHPKVRSFEIDLSNRCNLSCSWCWFKESKKAKWEDMDTKLALRLIDKAVDEDCGVMYAGGGEPTLHEDFEEIMKYSLRLLGIGLVSNGVNVGKIRRYLEITKDHPNAWVRLSLNERPINDELRQLFKDYPGQIGISEIVPDKNKTYPCEELRPLAKFIRKKEPTTTKDADFDEKKCRPRLFERVYEVDGTIAYCCISRGNGGKHPDVCPADCRWRFGIEEAWKENPGT